MAHYPFNRCHIDPSLAHLSQTAATPSQSYLLLAGLIQRALCETIIHALTYAVRFLTLSQKEKTFNHDSL